MSTIHYRAWPVRLTKVHRTEIMKLLTFMELPRAYRLGTRQNKAQGGEKA